MIKSLTTSFIAAAVLLGGHSTASGNDLETTLRDAGWEHIIGTWVDPETNGKTSKLSFEWLYPGKVIQITNRGDAQETTALMARHPKSGEVSYVAADNQGGSSIGKWTIDGDDAVLEFLYVSGSGDEGALQVRHTMSGKDSMTVTVVLPEPITYKLVRAKTDE